ncbi:MAG: class I SAM-dependent methyltransferase [Deltaproteobacteria bacterium]|nr:class I SAM-dependent methyltransferase [Deltaproteobacteria bacterium]
MASGNLGPDLRWIEEPGQAAQAAATPPRRGSCSACGAPLRHTFVDLGMSPLCESYVPEERLNEMERFYPLHAWVCGQCFLVQVEEYATPEEIFSEYAYFSSFSESWVAHMRRYAGDVAERFGLGRESLVVEVGSNDGYLLQHFAARGIPVLGIEPAANVARVAVERGIPTLVRFFGEETARQLVAGGRRADLLCGANVLAQVPRPRDFLAGVALLLADDGVCTFEFPHLLQLMAGNQFDTIYHEHFSYFSFLSAERLFAASGLVLFDVEELPTHGGSLRVYGRHAADTARPVTERVGALRQREVDAGLLRLETYDRFAEQTRETKRKLLEFLVGAKRAGKKVVGYGAPGKGNTLLNYCGIRGDFLDFTVDRSPYKQGKYLPGTHLPILAPEAIRQAKPDYVLILPWNLQEEIVKQMAHVREWGGRFVVPIPEVRVLE